MIESVLTIDKDKQEFESTEPQKMEFVEEFKEHLATTERQVGFLIN